MTYNKSHKAGNILRRITVMALILAVYACGKKQRNLLPDAGGRPYEVLVVASDTAASNIIKDALEADAPGLPQPEPMFDVSATKPKRYTPAARMARAIVIVKTDSTQYTATHIKYERNVYAEAQIIIYVTTPSADRLRRDRNAVGRHVTQLLTRAEMSKTIEQMKGKRNKKAESMVDSIVGCAVKMPARMRKSKRGNKFVWFTDDSPAGMQNICIYSYKGTDMSPERIIAARDSIMKANIHGEKPGTYMTTSKGYTTWTTEQTKTGRKTICRGLWEMEGDAMGGPFVCHCFTDSARGRVVVAEAFVYAPGMKKRNSIRQAEAILYTVKNRKLQGGMTDAAIITNKKR